MGLGYPVDNIGVFLELEAQYDSGKLGLWV